MKKIRKKTKKQRKLIQWAYISRSISLSLPQNLTLFQKRKKGFCLGINYSGSVPSKPLIPTVWSFSWEINYIKRKRSSSLVSFLASVHQTWLDLYFFLTNSYYYLLFYLLCKSHHYHCNYNRYHCNYIS